METKLSKVRTLMAAADTAGALRICARFPQLGAQKLAITRAWDALQRPDFYRQIGKNPDALVAEGIAAIRARYDIATPA